MTRLLSPDEVAQALAGLPDWSGTTEAIERTVKAADFPAAIAIVNEIAEAAEEADHHPDIDIRWRTLTLRLSTHSAGGVTEKDIQLARRIDGIVAARA